MAVVQPAFAEWLNHPKTECQGAVCKQKLHRALCAEAIPCVANVMTLVLG